MVDRLEINISFLLAIFFYFMMAPILCAQQDPQYTQYMYTPQVFNPAYIGSKNTTSLGVLGRWQWAGFEGAPNTGTFVGNTFLGTQQKTAVGLSIIHEKIGPISQSFIHLDYAYNIKIGNNENLSLGLKSGINQFNIDFNELNIADQGDIFERLAENNLRFQTGVGIYYNSRNFYAGISVPNFLNNVNLQTTNLATIEVLANERIHYYLITGYIWNINNNVKLKPATLLKLVKGAPLQWDISSNWLFYEKFTLGISYRWSASISALTGFQITDKFFLGLAYDYQSTEINTYSTGSYEFLIRFNLFKRRNCKCSTKPRFY